MAEIDVLRCQKVRNSKDYVNTAWTFEWNGIARFLSKIQGVQNDA